jgi:alpha-tubulin suppressor-like RCC1 family protein
MYNTCVLFEQGQVKCWGGNLYGQLGYGDRRDRTSPPTEFVPTGPEKIIQMALGDSHTCVLFEQGQTKCWGGNKYGQLGYGDKESRSFAPNEFLELN